MKTSFKDKRTTSGLVKSKKMNVMRGNSKVAVSGTKQPPMTKSNKGSC